MKTFITVSLIIHVFAGSVALLSGAGAILFRKRVKIHRQFGKIYFWCMSVVFITALYVSVYKQNYVLLFIAIFTYHACLTAYRSLKLKKLHAGQKPLFADWLIEGLNILANLGLCTIAAVLLLRANYQWAAITFVFGTFGIRGSISNLKRLRGKVSISNYWLLAHIRGMLGSYIGGLTAFLVNNNRWIGMPDVFAWLAPTMVLLPFIFYEVSVMKKKGHNLAA